MNEPHSLNSLPPEGSGQSASDGRAGAGTPSGKKIRVKLMKSMNSCKEAHRASVRGLGLKWREHTVEVEDTPSVRGMINKVSYLVKVVEA
jgi:large subunit ribosomal protein L30